MKLKPFLHRMTPLLFALTITPKLYGNNTKATDQVDLNRDIDEITERQKKVSGSELDEFQLAGERQKQKKSDKSKGSSEDAIEREIQALRLAEQKQRLREETLRREKEIKQRREEAKKAGKLSKRERKAIDEELKGLPTVDDEDISWRGLDGT